MFGLFGRADEKLAKKLERVMMSQEAAYEKGNWPVFVYAGKQALRLMQTLMLDHDWTDEKLETFLSKRGLVKSMSVPGYRDAMMAAQSAAGAYY